MSEIIRVEKNRNYTVMSNFHLADRRLSLKAIGLLSKILSLPDEWDYTIAGLTTICCEGKAAIATAIQELEATGYIVRRQLRTKDGAFGGNEYIVYEAPCCAENAPQPDFRLTDNPATDFPSTENRPQLNTNIANTNIPPIVPHKRARREAKKKPDWKPDRFADFWQAYPRGESKQAAINAWDRLKPDDELLEEMARGLMRQLKSKMWQVGIGIPYASTWLNQRRWEDKQKKLTPQCEDNGGLVEWL